jgi:ubiquinone biosynthesis protein COQ4
MLATPMLKRLHEAITAFRAHRADPEDVAKGVHYLDAFGQLLGRGDAAMLGRMRETALGRKLLDERHDVLAILANRDRLLAMPEDSLGHSYARFAIEKELFPEKLAEVVREARVASGGLVPNASEEVGYLHDRYRDLHDLWHVLVGYGTDMAGEYALIAFQTRQTGYRSMAIGAFSSMSMAALRGRPDMFRTWFEGRRRGARAPYLMAQDWERILPMPLEAAREELRLNPAPHYRTFDYAPAAAA